MVTTHNLIIMHYLPAYIPLEIDLTVYSEIYFSFS